MAKVALADFSADESKEPEQTTPIRGFDDLDDPKDVEGAAPLLVAALLAEGLLAGRQGDRQQGRADEHDAAERRQGKRA